jgi:ATP synthase protein I
MTKTPKKQDQDKQNPYLKYTGMAFQMVAIIGLSVWGGIRLDAWLGMKFPVFLVVLSVLGFVGAILAVIKSLPR